MQRYKTIALTGATGNMGNKVVEELMKSDFVKIKILALNETSDRKLLKKWTKKYGNRIHYFFGNVANYADCFKLAYDSDYLINMAAVIPPEADHDHEKSERANLSGVENIVRAVENQNGKTKLIHISSVAIYGHRNAKHPWGRVGDPLLPSAYDVYAMAKLLGERSVLDSSVQKWVILRQTGILYDKLLINNVSDGLMFHTCFNSPIEWVTDTDSATLIRNIIENDAKSELKNFWKRIFNIGGGENYRTTGYESFDVGFALIGGNAKKFLEPCWQAKRNFHCIWFEDSKELQERFDFQTGSFNEFWLNVLDKHPYFALARFLPKEIIKTLVFRRLLSNSNAPNYWVKNNDEGKIIAYYGGRKEYEELKKGWDVVKLFCKNETDGLDYLTALNENKIEENGFKLDHGFDENKPHNELDIEDMRKAAAFRGGKCLSETMIKGDLYTKLKWQCSEGHIFYATPYAVLFGGHWCEKCLDAYKWNFDALAKNNPFYAQVWYDSHDRNENKLYYFDKNSKSHVLGD